ncbi:hypothetical protein H2201_008886 [Coniosporium apollinis]|uniref:Cupin type-1 domain-containing protein n=1 Tax=Coniosporium apollinis TaxID=61459 RepID=A0ABQ9NF58_9PEZI|nr:hypothetical protein H2201_008886 [Coniosporium apollinis]
MAVIEPEQHWLRPTPHVPNSKLPFLVYRGVFKGQSADEIKKHIEANKWLKGGQWKTYKIAHFHTNTHECYAVLSGETLYEVGKSPIDDEFDADGKRTGFRVWLEQGDVFVLPAGISHCSVESVGDYEHMGFYPEDSPKWDMNFGKEPPEQTPMLGDKAQSVPIPDLDPVYGALGPLPKIWRENENS